MARVPKKVADRFATTVGAFQRVLADAKDRDVNESDTVTRHCQVADERAFFSLGAERPSLGQQAHVTSSH